MSASKLQQRPRELQQLHPHFTSWHITFGTYGARLHGGARFTVDRRHNQRGESFIGRDSERRQSEHDKLKSPALILSGEQCVSIEAALPSICERGGWIVRTCSASPPPRDGDHVHILLDAPPESPPKTIRELLKRWLTQTLNEHFKSDPSEPARPRAGAWWAEGGSTKPVKDPEYLNNAFNYIQRQRATVQSNI
ncbi:MAG: hypothetical protein L0Y42_00820 [Phycisphaerales bacterium]|nr:hypothetical protein [Phycisphaerales bacterium]